MSLNPNGIRFRIMVALVVILLVAILVEVLWIAPNSRQYHEKAALTFQAEMASQMAASFDHSFRQAIREIDAIASLPDVASMQKERLDRALGEVNRVTQFFNYYFVLDTEGRWVSFPTAPERVGQGIPEMNMGWVRKTVKENRTVFLDVVRSLVGTLVSGFATPIHDEQGRTVGVLRGVIVTSDENSVLQTVLGVQVAASGYPYVVSADGWLIAHPGESIGEENFSKYDYKKYPPVENCVQGKTGVSNYLYKGEMWVAAYHPIESTGWCVVVQQPEADILAEVRQETGRLHATTVGMSVAIALVLAVMLSLSLRPLERLVSAVRERRSLGEEAFSRDEVGQLAGEFHRLYAKLSRSESALRDHRNSLEELVAERTTRLRESNERLEQEVAERRRAEEAVRSSLKEKDVLLREIHHRVKNNMQVVSSILSLQAAATENKQARGILRDSQGRIRSMALMQERLFELDDLAHMDFEHYVRQVGRMLYRMHETDAGRIALETDMGDVDVDVDTAIPCGIIVNELVSNSLRHAFPGNRRGTIRVSLSRAGERELELTVSDDGVGMPQEALDDAERSLGLRLVRTLAEGQLRGKVDISAEGGTTVAVTFQPPEYEHRV